jgi:sugar/nucleoside kinase (ribokinase family)
LDIIGLGLSTLDVLMRLGEMPTWERGCSLSGFRLDGGGMVGTACVAAARLGARVGYVGTAGSDEAADLKLRSLREAGVDLSRMRIDDGPEREVVVVCVQEETGERLFLGLKGIRSSMLTAEDLDRDYIASAPFLHLDGWHPEAALQAARWTHEAGGRVAMDASKTDGRPVGDGTRELVAQVDILICGSGFGKSFTGSDDTWEAGRKMLKAGPSIVVQTEGERGSYTVTADECFHTPAFPVEVVDTTGAGDVFHGAYLVGLLKGWDLPTVARFSTAVSALKCLQLGGRRGIPTFEQTMAFLEQDAELGRRVVRS